MKYSHIAVALAATTASSNAFAPQGFSQRISKQKTSSTQLFYQNDNDNIDEEKDISEKYRKMLVKTDSSLSAKDNIEEEKSDEFSKHEIGIEKNIAKMFKLGAHIVNPLRSEPLTPRQQMIKDHVVDPLAKLSGGCALIGATGIFAVAGTVKLTADALQQNFPETFGNNESVEQINKSQAKSDEVRTDSFASKVAKDYLSKVNGADGQVISR